MKKNQTNNGLLILTVIILTAFPVLFIKGEFEGADGKAQEAIEEIQPTYKPWFKPVLELPSGEVESLLFVLQGSMGAGMIGYVIGLYKGRKEAKQDKMDE